MVDSTTVQTGGRPTGAPRRVTTTGRTRRPSGHPPVRSTSDVPLPMSNPRYSRTSRDMCRRWMRGRVPSSVSSQRHTSTLRPQWISDPDRGYGDRFRPNLVYIGNRVPRSWWARTALNLEPVGSCGHEQSRRGRVFPRVFSR